MKRIFLFVILFGGLTVGAQAQDFHMPAPSPKVSVDQQFSTSYIELEYSRPSTRGREIFGELVPYGSVWRTGANAATTIEFGEKVYIKDHMIKPGKYAIYTIPGEKEWTVILNSESSNWGAAGYEKSKDVLRIEVPVHSLKNRQESFRISLENLTKNSADLVMAWADTRIQFPIKARNNEQILTYLKKALQGENPPYAQAAGYYLATGQKLKRALEYVGKAIEKNPKAYYLYWDQAQIYEKLGEHEKALQSAKKAAEMAEGKPAFEYEYQQNYQSLLNKE